MHIWHRRLLLIIQDYDVVCNVVHGAGFFVLDFVPETIPIEDLPDSTLRYIFRVCIPVYEPAVYLNW